MRNHLFPHWVCPSAKNKKDGPHGAALDKNISSNDQRRERDFARDRPALLPPRLPPELLRELLRPRLLPPPALLRRFPLELIRFEFPMRLAPAAPPALI